MASKLISRGLDDDIAMTHARFVRAMETRLPSLNIATKERYLAVLSALVAKLESPDKNLRDILGEMMVEAAAHIMEEMNA
jgi:hypothetical protein